jgi:CDP-diacylglycerol--serine O-phosphatidyltransferase
VARTKELTNGKGVNVVYDSIGKDTFMQSLDCIKLALPWVMFALTIYAGITMVSNAMFYSGKALDVRYRAPFGVMILIILGFVLVSSDPPVALFGLFVAYAISGYVFWVWQKIVLRKKKASDMLSNN